MEVFICPVMSGKLYGSVCLPRVISGRWGEVFICPVISGMLYGSVYLPRVISSTLCGSVYLPSDMRPVVWKCLSAQ
jgi:hypothetical protein